MERSDPQTPATVDPEKGAELRESLGNMALAEVATSGAKDVALSGFKLYITLFSLMTAGFLIAFDASVVVTVSGPFSVFNND